MGQTLKNEQYLSIDAPVDFEINIKRSRFISSLRAVSNRIEFDEALKKINELYPKANHYCWAYRFTENPILEHASDAGEPPGSAGRPILGTLKKNSLLNIMAVVTRYYGGIKLGISGLICAYGEVTAQAISKAKIIQREPMTSFDFSCSYEMYNSLLDTLKRFHISSEDIKANFGEIIIGEFEIPLRKIEMLLKEFAEMKYSGYLTYRQKKSVNDILIPTV